MPPVPVARLPRVHDVYIAWHWRAPAQAVVALLLVIMLIVCAIKRKSSKPGYDNIEAGTSATRMFSGFAHADLRNSGYYCSMCVRARVCSGRLQTMAACPHTRARLVTEVPLAAGEDEGEGEGGGEGSPNAPGAAPEGEGEAEGDGEPKDKAKCCCCTKDQARLIIGSILLCGAVAMLCVPLPARSSSQ